SSWKVRRNDTEASEAESGASMRRHFSPRMAVATCNVSLFVAPARFVCANAGAAANRQPPKSKVHRVTPSVPCLFRGDGRSLTDGTLDLVGLSRRQALHRNYTRCRLNGK